MSSQALLYLVIGVAVLGLLIYRPLVVIGLVETVGYMQNLHAGSAAVIALVGSLVLAAVFGAHFGGVRPDVTGPGLTLAATIQADSGYPDRYAARNSPITASSMPR